MLMSKLNLDRCQAVESLQGTIARNDVGATAVLLIVGVGVHSDHGELIDVSAKSGGAYEIDCGIADSRSARRMSSSRAGI